MLPLRWYVQELIFRAVETMQTQAFCKRETLKPEKL